MAYIKSTDFEAVLTQINVKRTLASLSPLSRTFSDLIKQSDIDFLRDEVVSILATYGYGDLEDALNNVGYAYATWKTWSKNWIATRSFDEMEDILDSMTTQFISFSGDYELVLKNAINQPDYDTAYSNALASSAFFSSANTNGHNGNTLAHHVFPNDHLRYCALRKIYGKFDLSPYNYGRILLNIDVEKTELNESIADWKIYYTTLTGNAESYWNSSGTLGHTITSIGNVIIDVTNWVNASNRIDFIGNLIPFNPDGGTDEDVFYEAFWGRPNPFQRMNMGFTIFTHT
ncbi:hypothetical protein LCGC14_1166430 [marine sediment metagenome]|uniref:Uncharacterized protein n=1 Tax=marine sediment metagenome TaxID=412755 RepID=A0A0F9ME43_9ZZZZ